MEPAQKARGSSLSRWAVKEPVHCVSHQSGHSISRMRSEVILAPDAAEAYNKLTSHQKSVCDALELYLRHEPTKISKSRIKRLRGVSRPQYRLRVNEIRAFYDLKETTVEILANVQKASTQ